MHTVTMFHFTLQDTLKKELDDACAVVESLKKEIRHLNEEARTSDEDAAILEKNRYGIAFPLFMQTAVTITSAYKQNSNFIKTSSIHNLNFLAP